MANLLADYQSIFTAVMSNISSLISTITSTPLLLVGFGMIFVSAVIARVRALV